VFIVDSDILDFLCFLLFSLVSTSATDYLERLVSEMTYIVSSGTLNSTATTIYPSRIMSL